MKTLVFRIISAYLRHTPFEKGRWSLMVISKKLVKDTRLSNPEVSITTRAGFPMHVNINDYVGRELYIWGEYETGVSRTLRRILAEGDGFVDIGANIGYYTVMASKYVGPSGKVIAFEPATVTRERLKANIQLASAENVEIFDFALSDDEGEAEFFLGPEDNSGMASLRFQGSGINKAKVMLRKFDNLNINMPNVRMIKLDVEGVELKVLYGMRKFLESYKPHIIVEITESFLSQFRHTPAELISFLEDLGYVKKYEITDNGLIPLGKKLPRQFNGFFTTNAKSLGNWALKP
ncbi:FkbM family methyltransferase [Sulfurirhabdus autotrophica]|nr:FkbM family methyltransferase [Sulfurirhabdus autotrophica]